MTCVYRIRRGLRDLCELRVRTYSIQCSSDHKSHSQKYRERNTFGSRGCKKFFTAFHPIFSLTGILGKLQIGLYNSHYSQRSQTKQRVAPSRATLLISEGRSVRNLCRVKRVSAQPDLWPAQLEAANGEGDLRWWSSYNSVTSVPIYSLSCIAYRITSSSNRTTVWGRSLTSRHKGATCCETI
jgi:hypothetical protein